MSRGGRTTTKRSLSQLVSGSPTTKRAGAAMAVLAVLGIVVAAALRGPSSGWLALTWTLTVAALVGVGAMLMPQRPESRREYAVTALMWTVAALVLANMVLNWVDLDQWVWRAPAYFPFTQPIGTDFRIGGYDAAQAFSAAKSGWPPLTVVAFMPYLLLEQDSAYVMHLVMLLVLNVATLGIAMSVSRGFTSGTGETPDESWRLLVGRLGPVLAMWLFASFGFLLAIERGSIDTFAVFFAMLGLACIIRRPSDVWTPAVLFGLATHLKVYPAVLFLLLIWRFRWRSIVPIAVVNVVLALIAGPKNLILYLGHMTGAVSNGAAWVGNQSAQSAAWWVGQLYGPNAPQIPVVVLIAVPAAVFALTTVLLWKRHDDESTALLAAALFPVMCLVPSISHDYKIVILAAPILLIAAMLMRAMGRTESPEPWWMLLTLCVALFFLGRAPGNLVDYGVPVQRFVWPALFMNKYAAVFLVQVLTLWMAWRLPALPPIGARSRARRS